MVVATGSTVAISLLCGRTGDRTAAGGVVGNIPVLSIPSGGNPMAIEVTSTAFAHGEAIPAKYTGEGIDVSPPISWSGLPEGTQELRPHLRRPRRPHRRAVGPLGHVQDPRHAGRAAGGNREEATAEGTLRSATRRETPGPAQNIGYRGPMPPPGHGTHRYFFKLYALEAKLVISPGVDKNLLLDEIKGHVLDEGVLVGTYKR